MQYHFHRFFVNISNILQNIIFDSKFLPNIKVFATRLASFFYFLVARRAQLLEPSGLFRQISEKCHDEIHQNLMNNNFSGNESLLPTIQGEFKYIYYLRY